MKKDKKKNVEEIMNIHIYYGSMDNYLKSKKNNMNEPKSTYISRIVSEVYDSDNRQIENAIKESYERSIKIDGIKDCVDSGLINTKEEVKEYLKKYNLSTSSKQKIK